MSQIPLFLMVFWIPHVSGERMGFGVTILLSITVYLLVISEKLPEKSDKTPMLGICFICEFYLLTMALMIAGITILLSRKKTEPPRFLIAMLSNNLGYCCKEKLKHGETIGMLIPLQESSVYQQNLSIKGKTKEECVDRMKKHARDFEAEWQQLARSIDKICFCIFFVVTVSLPFVIKVAIELQETP